jgi:hypothetical protein
MNCSDLIGDPVSKESWQKYWRHRDAWTVREFAQLCCGWNPSLYTFPDRDAYNEALESINRAVRVRALPIIDDLAWPSTPAERLYEAVPTFRPNEVIAWALAHYPKKFPFDAAELAPGSSAMADLTELPNRLRQLLEIARNVSAGQSQKEIAGRIQKELGTSERDAQAYASLIRPDKSIERDRRAARRRDTAKSFDEK